MLNKVELSEIIAIKICHDLSGPIGAFSNGIELLEDNNSDYFQSSLELVQTTSKSAVSKILYFRQAYGTLSKSTEFSIEKLTNIISQFLESSKVKFTFEASDIAGNIDNYSSKILLNLVLIIEKSLIFGGDLKIDFKSSANISVHANGKSVKLKPEHVQIISSYNDDIQIEVGNVNPYLIHLFAKDGSKNLNISHSDESVNVNIS